MSSSYAADATIGYTSQWQWITRRGVEPAIEKWLHISSSVVLIRG